MITLNIESSDFQAILNSNKICATTNGVKYWVLKKAHTTIEGILELCTVLNDYSVYVEGQIYDIVPGNELVTICTRVHDFANLPKPKSHTGKKLKICKYDDGTQCYYGTVAEIEKYTGLTRNYIYKILAKCITPKNYTIVYINETDTNNTVVNPVDDDELAEILREKYSKLLTVTPLNRDAKRIRQYNLINSIVSEFYDAYTACKNADSIMSELNVSYVREVCTCSGVAIVEIKLNK